MKRTILLLSVLSLLLGALPAAAEGGTSWTGDPDLPDMDVLDPVRFSYGEAIRSRHLLPGRDGLQTIAFDLIRPNTSEPVPTIMVSSPYYNTNGRFSYDANGNFVAMRKTPWGSPSNTASPTTPFPEQYDEDYVPRGYAVLLHDLRGTRNSSGCQVYGHRSEAEDAVDIIDWVAKQSWSNGAVGMIGGSYDGTIANGAASMAPDALKAIVPIRAIDRWYDYHHFNGVLSSNFVTPFNFSTVNPVTDLQNSSAEDQRYGLHVVERRACAASIGGSVGAQYANPVADSKSLFWSDRDYIKDAAKMKAATFIVHGLRDDNVKPFNASHLWEALPAGTPKKLWWLRGGHDNPHNPKLPMPVNVEFEEELHRWFAQFLKGLDAGALDTPPVVVQDEEGTLRPAAQWPLAEEDLELYLTPSGLTTEQPDAGATISYTDRPAGMTSVQLHLDVDLDLHISGYPVMSLRYALPNGGDTTFAYRLEDVTSGTRVVSRGYARASFRDQIQPRGMSYPTLPGAPHAPGNEYTITFPLYPTDHLVPAGSRLRLTLTADDNLVEGHGTGTTQIRVGPSKLVLPVGPGREAAEVELAG
jgi:X-Pro dipeptidyl-peptidase